MAETVEIRKPRNAVLGTELPRSKSTVRASSLLSNPELEAFRKTGSILIVDADGMYFPVTLNTLVPATARIVREKDGVIYGLPAVTGG